MLAIQKVALGTGDKELGAVGVRARVGHGEETRRRVFELKGFVGEAIAAVNASGACTVPVEKVPALDHKVFDDPMELGALVPLWHSSDLVLSRAELAETFKE